MSPRAKFFEIISNIFDFQRNRTGKAIALFAFSFVSLGWFLQATYNLLVLFSKHLVMLVFDLKLLADPHKEWLSTGVEIILPTLLFVIAFCIMWLNYHRNTRKNPILNLEPPTPHEGLILMLSPYNPRNSSLTNITTFPELLNEQGLDKVRQELLKSNWGPLVVAIEHHRTLLRHCWLVCTTGARGSESSFETAKEVIQAFGGKNVKCTMVSLDAPNDLSQVITIIRNIYKEAAYGVNLEPTQIIADFTGGTAAMSGGMILATVEKDYQIEYLRQDKPLFRDTGEALTPDEIRNEQILVTIRTSPALLSVNAPTGS